MDISHSDPVVLGSPPEHLTDVQKIELLIEPDKITFSANPIFEVDFLKSLKDPSKTMGENIMNLLSAIRELPLEKTNDLFDELEKISVVNSDKLEFSIASSSQMLNHIKKTDEKTKFASFTFI